MATDSTSGPQNFETSSNNHNLGITDELAKSDAVSHQLAWNTLSRTDCSPPYVASPWSRHSVSVIVLDLKDPKIQDSLQRIERLRACMCSSPSYDHAVLFFAVGNGIYWIDQDAERVDMVGRTAQNLNEHGTSMSNDEVKRRFHYMSKQQTRITTRSRRGRWTQLPTRFTFDHLQNQVNNHLIPKDDAHLPQVSDEERIAGIWYTGLWVASLLGGPQETLFPSIHILSFVSDKSLCRLSTSPRVAEQKDRRKNRPEMGKYWSHILAGVVKRMGQDESVPAQQQQLLQYLKEIRWMWAFSFHQTTIDILQPTRNASMMFRSLQQLVPLLRGNYILPRFPQDPPYYWEYSCLSAMVFCPVWYVYPQERMDHYPSSLQSSSGVYLHGTHVWPLSSESQDANSHPTYSSPGAEKEYMDVNSAPSVIYKVHERGEGGKNYQARWHSLHIGVDVPLGNTISEKNEDQKEETERQEKKQPPQKENTVNEKPFAWMTPAFLRDVASEKISLKTLDEIYANTIASCLLWSSSSILREWDDFLQVIGPMTRRLEYTLQSTSALKTSFPLCFSILEYLRKLQPLVPILLRGPEKDKATSGNLPYVYYLQSLYACEYAFRCQILLWNAYHHGDWAPVSVGSDIHSYVHQTITAARHQYEKPFPEECVPLFLDVHQKHRRPCITYQIKEHMCARMTEFLFHRDKAVSATHGRPCFLEAGPLSTEQKNQGGYNEAEPWTHLRGYVGLIHPNFSDIQEWGYLTRDKGMLCETNTNTEQTGLVDGVPTQVDPPSETLDETIKEADTSTRGGGPLFCHVESWWAFIDPYWAHHWKAQHGDHRVSRGRRQAVERQVQTLRKTCLASPRRLPHRKVKNTSGEDEDKNNSTTSEENPSTELSRLPLFFPTLPDDTHLLGATHVRQDILAFIHMEWNRQFANKSDNLAYAFTPSCLIIWYARLFLTFWKDEKWIPASRILKMLLFFVGILGEKVFPRETVEVDVWGAPLSREEKSMLVDLLGTLYCVSQALFTATDQYTSAQQRESRRQLFQRLYNRSPGREEFDKWVNETETAAKQAAFGNEGSLSEELQGWFAVNQEQAMHVFDYSFYQTKDFIKNCDPAYRVEESFLRARERVEEETKSKKDETKDDNRPKETATAPKDSTKENNEDQIQKRDTDGSENEEEKEEGPEEGTLAYLRKHYGTVPDSYAEFSRWCMLLWLFPPSMIDTLTPRVESLRESLEATSSSTKEDNDQQDAPSHSDTNETSEKPTSEQNPEEQTTLRWPFNGGTTSFDPPSFKWYRAQWHQDQQLYSCQSTKSVSYNKGLSLAFVEALSGLSYPSSLSDSS
jgi:hypothetical protein